MKNEKSRSDPGARDRSSGDRTTIAASQNITRAQLLASRRGLRSHAKLKLKRARDRDRPIASEVELEQRSCVQIQMWMLGDSYAREERGCQMLTSLSEQRHELLAAHV